MSKLTVATKPFTREKYHHILDNNTHLETTVKQVDSWITALETKKITTFDTFIKTLQTTKKYVASYVKYNLSNGITERLTNLVRSIRCTAFGMPNFQNSKV